MELIDYWENFYFIFHVGFVELMLNKHYLESL